MAEYPLPTEVPPHGWTCFCCGETFTDIESAADHFGQDSGFEPGCVERLTTTEKEMRHEIMQANREMQGAQEAAHRAEQIADEALQTMAYERRLLPQAFKGATTFREAQHILQDTEGKVLAAEAFIHTIERIAPAAVAQAREELKLYPDAYKDKAVTNDRA